MKSILSAAAIAVAFTMTAGAQSTTQPQSSATDTKSSSKASAGAKAVTLTGCLREGDTPNSFFLDNVQKTDKSMTSSEYPSTGGTAATGTSGEMRGQVKLVGAADLNLKDHVGHRVEVTGTMGAGKMTEKSSMPSSSSATGTSGAKGDKDKEHTLRVRALKHVAATCQ